METQAAPLASPPLPAPEDSSSSRKRPRTPTVASTGPHKYREKEQQIIAQLRDPSTRNQGLNDLLKYSGNHEYHYACSSDKILKLLANLATEECLQWKSDPEGDDVPTFRAHQTWFDAPTFGSRAWIAHCRSRLAGRPPLPSEQLLLVVLTILRNLSFTAANLRLMAYSPQIVNLLVACVYQSYPDWRGGDDSFHAPVLAMNTLVHLAPHLDVSGQKLATDKLFYAPQRAAKQDGPLVPSDHFGQAVGGQWGLGGVWLAKRLDTKEDTIADVSKQFLLELTQDYLVAVWSLFGALYHALTVSPAPRSVTLAALELLQELINQARVGVVGTVELDDDDESIPTLRAILVHMPDTLIDRLVSLLYVPRNGPDALEYLDPIHNVVNRVTTLRLCMGYDATVDTEVRDRVLELIVPLLELDSPRMARRFGTLDNGRPRLRLYDAIAPILTTTAGRNEAPVLASQFLRELSKAHENRLGLVYLQSFVARSASRDTRLSHALWNHLIVPEEEEEEEEEDH